MLRKDRFGKIQIQRDRFSRGVQHNDVHVETLNSSQSSQPSLQLNEVTEVLEPVPNHFGDSDGKPQAIPSVHRQNPGHSMVQDDEKPGKKDLMSPNTRKWMRLAALLFDIVSDLVLMISSGTPGPITDILAMTIGVDIALLFVMLATWKDIEEGKNIWYKRRRL